MAEKTSKRTTAKKEKPPTVTAAQILDLKQPKRLEYSMVINDDEARALAEAEKALADAETRVRFAESVAKVDPEAKPDAGLAKKVKEAEKQLEAAMEAAKGSTVKFVFQAIAASKMDKILRQNPPTKAQIAEVELQAKQQSEPVQPVEFDREKVGPIVISECLIDPVFTLEEAQALWLSDRFSFAERESLFVSALAVNQTITK